MKQLHLVSYDESTLIFTDRMRTLFKNNVLKSFVFRVHASFRNCPTEFTAINSI